MKGQLAAMMARHARAGQLDWIGLRAERRADVREAQEAVVTPDGIEGDHGRAGKRAVTLLQAEHIPVVSALAGRAVTAAMLRRNLVISGINLAAFRKGTLRIGDVTLQIEGPCPPCSRMEEIIGPGGYSAVRGHGGWYASVISGGPLATGMIVSPPPAPN